MTEIRALTGIRAIAALWVVLHHYYEFLVKLWPPLTVIEPVAAGGRLGVELFFTLSGFILTYTYVDKFRVPTVPEYKRFLNARLARLYPVHLMCLAGLAVIVAAGHLLHLNLRTGDMYTLSGLLASVFLVQAWGDHAYATWNFVAWSVSAEWFAYLTFPLTALLFWRVRTMWSAVLIAAVALVVTIMLFQYGGLSAVSPFDHRGLLRIIGCFLAGAMMYWLYRHGVGRTWAWSVLVPVNALLIIVGLYVTSAATATLPWFALLMPTLILGLAWHDRGALTTRPALYWGRVSYSLYMTHLIVKQVVGEVLPPERFMGSVVGSVVGTLVYLVPVAVVAMLMYHVVEEPGRRLIRRVGSRRVQPAVAS
ncbi:peptidoglycan/LPS O-acetylase OafA/YrhL [Deinococcus metalli]|uniref:Acyltransferase n=1 Tax=Deinococcus metalli TaxID=1141878 RepID=A0A7W8NSP6_9DEIO|nr:acyltransferase [Deinococcus metalli]MBB5378198.1 peptidoglycan/LPS O-acetylase OafA/YrhL [Deinococcus metalli]GHF56762.1 acyltransferase [Deinococcus metalli]